MQIKKTNYLEKLEKSVSRRSVLKVAMAATAAVVLKAFPELGGVKNVSAAINYCYGNGVAYCCDINVYFIFCTENGCPFGDGFWVEYRWDCGDVFGCSHNCIPMCHGPAYTCSLFCMAPAGACWMCPN